MALSMWHHFPVDGLVLRGEKDVHTSRASMPAFVFAAHDLAHEISLKLKHRPCRVVAGEQMVFKFW